MRIVLLTALALVLTVTSPAVAQDESPADEAIQEAITILEARKAQAEVRVDQEKIAKAIAALEKYLTKNNDPDAPKEPLKITPTQLRKKLQAKAVFNPKTNELTLVYDLSKPDQLKDFELNGAEPVVRNGVLRVSPADTITHVVQFETVSVTGQFVVENIGAGESDLPFIRTTPGVAFCVGEYNGAYLKLAQKGKSLGVKQVGRDQIQNKPLPIAFSVKDKKASTKVGSAEFAGVIEAGSAGQVELLGGKGGLQVRSLVISGTLDEEWAAEFFAD